MRNTLEYPISYDEVIAALELARDGDDSVGDTRCMIFGRLLDRFRGNRHLAANVFNGDGHFDV